MGYEIPEIRAEGNDWMPLVGLGRFLPRFWRETFKLREEGYQGDRIGITPRIYPIYQGIFLTALTLGLEKEYIQEAVQKLF